MASYLWKLQSCVPPGRSRVPAWPRAEYESSSAGTRRASTLTCPPADFKRRAGHSLVALCALLAAPLLAGCSLGGEGDAAAEPADAPRVVQPGAPGEPPRELSPEEVENLEYPTHTDADVRFMQGMVLHHEQALQMTALVPDRAARKDLPLFAKRLEISQQDEIGQMQRWLEERGEDSRHHGDHDHSSHLPGMLTAAELAQLEAASGKRFDRLFLEFMIRHHEGALAMVERLQAEGGGQEAEISQFTSHVVGDQTIEIGRMVELLRELGE